jgi:hypothetical protein
MTVLNELQMRSLDGEGFWDGFLCGTAVAFLVGMSLSPDPISKLAWGLAWSSALGKCGGLLF